MYTANFAIPLLGAAPVCLFRRRWQLKPVGGQNGTRAPAAVPVRARAASHKTLRLTTLAFIAGTWAAGGASWAMFYVYLLGFDFMNAVGHCNFEFVPTSLYMVSYFPT